MNLDVFFCSAPQNDERMELAERMISLWRTIPNIRIVPLYPKILGSRYFQRDRRMIAEHRATSSIYILTDDDMEPMFHFNKAIKLMKQHPDFGMLSAFPDPAVIQRWTLEGYKPYEDEDVMEHIDVGGLRFIRKGIMKHWPEQKRSGYDREHCEEMRRNGFRVGYMKHLHAIHHGEGASTLCSAR